MHKLGGMAGALAVMFSASFAATAVAARTVATGDTCVANATGTQYTLTVSLPANAPQQDGFAVGAQGGAVTDLTIGGIPGTASTTGLPSGTQKAWLFGSPQGVPGASVTINVQADTASAKSFTVAPYDQEHQTWFDAFTCPVSDLTKTTAADFTIGNRFAYNARAHSWGFSITVSGAGTLAVSQNGGIKPLIMARRTKVTRAGAAKMTLATTAAGRAALAKTGVLKLRLSVTFSPADGTKPRTRTLSVTLRK
jgi:hypothetical protein